MKMSIKSVVCSVVAALGVSASAQAPLFPQQLWASYGASCYYIGATGVQDTFRLPADNFTITELRVTVMGVGNVLVEVLDDMDQPIASRVFLANKTWAQQYFISLGATVPSCVTTIRTTTLTTPNPRYPVKYLCTYAESGESNYGYTFSTPGFGIRFGDGKWLYAQEALRSPYLTIIGRPG